MAAATDRRRYSSLSVTVAHGHLDPENLRLAAFLCAVFVIAGLSLPPHTAPVDVVSLQGQDERPSVARSHPPTPVIPALERPDARTASLPTATAPDYESPYHEAFVAHRWGLTAIDVPGAWAAGYAGNSAKVAILDTGIDTAVPCLADRVAQQANFTDSPTTDDIYGHGTHMAGIVLAIAPEVTLMNVKVADDRGKCSPAALAKGIRWAAINHANVINLSLCSEQSSELEAAVQFAHAKGAVVVAAAGNGGGTEPAYPAFYEECIAVAALHEAGRLTDASNHGEWVDIAAPGADVFSLSPRGRPGYRSGTSPAAAHVSGVAALVFAAATDLNDNGRLNDEVRDALEQSCGSATVPHVRCGVVNALRAVTGRPPGT
ncbi:MAG: S8 family serine peptidase [Chloroflexota bacterium]